MYKKIPEMQAKNLAVQRGNRSAMVTGAFGSQGRYKSGSIPLTPTSPETGLQALMRWAVGEFPAQTLCAGALLPASVKLNISQCPILQMATLRLRAVLKVT